MALLGSLTRALAEWFRRKKGELRVYHERADFRLCKCFISYKLQGVLHSPSVNSF